MDTKKIQYLRRVLSRWYGANRRDLPWRETNDPYAIWVSEIMLQQTRVATVIDYYKNFLRLFPDVESLAQAPVDDLLAAWSGLGYYRRARHLKDAALMVMERFGGKVPTEEDDLLALPGVGRYTAGAIRSIAFGKSAPILDGNVFRVIARFFAVHGSWTDQGDKRRFWEIAEGLVPRSKAGDFNQALMEWGALVCTPKGPACAECPVRRRCAALDAGSVDQYPAPRARPVVRAVRLALLVYRDQAGRVLLRRRPSGGRLEGMWELPEGIPENVAVSEKAGTFRHAIMNERYEVTVYRAPGDEPPADAGEWTWVSREDLASWPVTTMAKKGIDLAAAAAVRSRAGGKKLKDQ